MGLSCFSEGELFRLLIAEMTGADRMKKRREEMIRVLGKINKPVWNRAGGKSNPKRRSGLTFCFPTFFLQRFFYIVFTTARYLQRPAELINATFSSRLTEQPINGACLLSYVPGLTNRRQATVRPGSRNSQSETTCGRHLGKGKDAA